MVPAAIIKFDEGANLGFQIAGQEVILWQDAVLEWLMPALDLAPVSGGCTGAPRTWLMPLVPIHSASSSAI